MTPEYVARPPRPSALWVLVSCLLAAVFGALGEAAGESPAVAPQALVEEILASDLDPTRAVLAKGLKLKAGPAQIELESGFLVPTKPVSGEVREVVFVGRGRVRLEVADRLEAQQLELFTGSGRIDEPIYSAVMVVAQGAAQQAMLERELVDGLPLAEFEAARLLFTEWRSSGERRLLQVDTMLVADVLGDRFAQSYFAGLFESKDLGRFLYVFDPTAYEQVSMGQFVTVETTDKEERKIGRRLAKQQRQGRLLGVELEDLGQWDTWTSSPLRQSGEPRHGGNPLDVEHYTIDLSVAPRTLELEATVRMESRSRARGALLVPLALQGDLRVSEVLSGDDRPLGFIQQGAQLSVFLEEPTEAGEAVALTIRYGGVLLEEVARARVLTDTLGWYPRTDETDLASFDVTLRWPEKFDLFGCGTVVDSGRSGKQRWERRRLNEPALGFTFEIGRFETVEAAAGDVDIVVAFDRLSVSLVEPETRQQIADTLADSLLYYQEVLGPYPYERLVAVSSPRAFSQSLPGFVTLSTAMISDDVWLRLLRGASDARSVVAHEVAHQWWGHIIGWQGYRDQWISEALAEWSALAYSKNRLKSRAAGPLRGWKWSLLSTTEDGRPVESLGPVVLGARLASSRSTLAYQAIVYKKGAVVMDMLAKRFGEANFLRILGALVKGLNGRRISTEDFLAAVEQITGQSLADFARQYVFGTGMPDVYYDYNIEPVEGGWRVSGEAVQLPSYRLDYRIRQTGEGYSLVRERVDLIDIGDSRMVVPVQVGVLDPAKAASSERLQTGNVIVTTTVKIEGARSPFEVELDLEPKQVWLDGLSEVLGNFVNRRHSPKQVLYYEGLQLAASGELDEADKKFRTALAAKSKPGPTLGGRERDPKRIEREDLRTDSGIHYSLCRLYLDAGRLEEAESELERGNALDRQYDKPGFMRPGRPAEAAVLEARLALRRGEAERAFKTLDKVVRKQRRISSRESLLALAIAAKLTGRSDALAETVDLAQKKGGDTSLLR